MTFRDGLLRARGQIVFVLALGLSIGVILWLETVNFDGHGEVRSTTLTGSVAPTDNIVSRNILDAVRRAELSLEDNPDSDEAVAALATALSAASLSAALDQVSARERIVPLLRRLHAADTPLASSALSVVAIAFPNIRDLPRLGTAE